MKVMDRVRYLADSRIEIKNADGAGLLIINADDWGRDFATTDSIFECIKRERVSCASGMVYMEDSARAAEIACNEALDIGLHLNFTTPFSAESAPAATREHQQNIAAYLRKSRISECIFNPTLINSFEYSIASQLEEYERLYGRQPARLDGHHHKHLCANIVFGKLLPAGTKVRRNFTLRAGEKGFFNRSYRRLVDRSLVRRHQLTDYFFSISPIEPMDRVERIFALSRDFVVEVETHPIEKDEFSFLNGDKFAMLAESLPLARRCELRST